MVVFAATFLLMVLTLIMAFIHFHVIDFRILMGSHEIFRSPEVK